MDIYREVSISRRLDKALEGEVETVMYTKTEAAVYNLIYIRTT